MHEASLKQNEETMAAEMELVEAAAKEEVRARRKSMQAKKDLEIDELKAQLVAKDEKLQVSGESEGWGLGRKHSPFIPTLPSH